MVVPMAIQHLAEERSPQLRIGTLERATLSSLGADVQQVFASLGDEYHELCEQLFAEDPELGLSSTEDLAPR